MPDQVYEIDRVVKRVLELLRRHDSFMTTGAVAISLDVPTYAADAALDAAHVARQVEHVAGVGWRALSADPPRPAPADTMHEGTLWTRVATERGLP